MAKSFDLVVIGTGAAAAGVASRCKSAGWKVAIVDNLPYGGTCQLRGCDPKKVLVGAAEIDHAMALAVGSDGSVFVADFLNHRIQKWRQLAN